MHPFKGFIDCIQPLNRQPLHFPRSQCVLYRQVVLLHEQTALIPQRGPLACFPYSSSQMRSNTVF